MKIDKLINKIAYVFIALFFSVAMNAAGHTFSTFSTGTITGGGAEVTTSLNVSGLTDNFLFYVVTGEFVAGGNPAYSNTIEMALTDGSSAVYKDFSIANEGALVSDANTTLVWTGMMKKPYTGGDPLTISIKDNFTDGSGPYTSELNNVTVTIYYAPQPVKSFSTFNTGTVTGGAAAVETSMDVSGLNLDYLFYSVSGDFVGGGNPAWSNTIEMEITDGGSTKYKSFSMATSGAIESSENTTLFWTGVMKEVYEGGGTLSINIKDNFTDGGGPYTSDINDVQVNIFPATDPVKEFSTFSTGTLTGGGSPVSTAMNVGGLTDDYLFYAVSADFVAGGNPAFSNTMEMEITDGGSASYKAYSTANSGAMTSTANTTLIWTGIMKQEYSGGSPLTVSFKDNFTDGDGPYTSELNNVIVQIFPVPSNVPLPVELESFTASITENGIGLNWQTATEVNNYGFEIERTSPLPSHYQGEGAEGGEGWTKIGFIEGAGNSNTSKSYSFSDLNLNLDPNLTMPTSRQALLYRLKQIDLDGKFTYSKEVEVQLENVPSEFALEQNYPNPFNPTTTIKYAIPNVETLHATSVQLKVYNLLGQEVATLVNEKQTAGNYEIKFEGSDLASGVYLYKLKAGDFVSVKRLVLMK